ncbi:metal transporter [Desulfobacterales bacterium HSG16]|nr:metal transporter [Desulfobacterales bacterium HSG16]
MIDPGVFSKEICSEKLLGSLFLPAETIVRQVSTLQNYASGFARYYDEFMTPFMISMRYFYQAEQDKLAKASPDETMDAYLDLLDFNVDIMNRFLSSSMNAFNEFNARETQHALAAWFNTIYKLKGEDFKALIERQEKIADRMANVYPKAILDIESEFGFHFEGDGNIKVAETDRFVLYQVLPVNKAVQVNSSAKPILIIPPFVLGANILSFLPHDNRSYCHCFANQGIPTYIRVLKEIADTPALQIMTGEDDANDTQYFCETIKARHGKPVTLNGYCQGGFLAVCDMLSGKLDGLVDALITCVSPIDGTRSVGFTDFLKGLPSRFNSLLYGTKTLPNGNKVADGLLMGWVYKLKSIENNAPLVAFYRDVMMLSPRNGKEPKISKTAAALNYWLQNERRDLPIGITEMSYASFNDPITDDGTLPVKLFGKKLNLKRIQEKKIKWLICYGEHDDLVEKNSAIAPSDFIEVETSAFPKGHVAIATSWSDPKSACPLHGIFGEEKYRGPVRFQLDLDKEMAEADQE